MILQGNQRGGATDLANHLLKDENDHVSVHELRGFIANDLHGALREAYAVSKATKAKQFMFSLSLNPPPEAKVSTASFEEAIKRVEDKLGLTGQPRAIVFHEKQGRRHCHTVWSRTDIKHKRAIQLSHTKTKLMEISKDLYLQHGWQMPKGMINKQERDPHNFTLAQWQQAKRIGKNPKEIKQALQDSWVSSNDRDSFADALNKRGYTLAKGDRRGYVALNQHCEIFAIAKKWIGVTTKDIKAKLEDTDNLPSVDEAKAAISQHMQARLTKLKSEHELAIEKRKAFIEAKRQEMVMQHKGQRDHLEKIQQERLEKERAIRQSRYRTGLRGLMDRVTGKYKTITRQNEQDILQALERDRKEKDDLIFTHLEQRRQLDQRNERLQSFTQQKQQELTNDISTFNTIAKNKQNDLHFRQQQRQYRTPKMEW